MSPPRCGEILECLIPGAEARQLLVVSEDPWNEILSDSVAIPVYEWDSKHSLFLVQVSEGMFAECTRVQSIPHEFFGERLGNCPKDPWIRSRMGVRKYLDIDNRIKKTTDRVPSIRTEWYPQQRDIHFSTSRWHPDRKLHGVISDDLQNSHPDANYCATARLTSQTKEWRARWEVPVSGGCVVTGDLYQTAYADIEREEPDPERFPTRLSHEESAEIAIRQKQTLTLK